MNIFRDKNGVSNGTLGWVCLIVFTAILSYLKWTILKFEKTPLQLQVIISPSDFKGTLEICSFTKSNASNKKCLEVNNNDTVPLLLGEYLAYTSSTSNGFEKYQKKFLVTSESKDIKVELVKYQRFIAAPTSNVVNDRDTNLVWNRCVIGQHWVSQQCTGSPKLLSYADFKNLSYSSNEYFDNYSGWRLPQSSELVKIVCKGGGYSPCLLNDNLREIFGIEFSNKNISCFVTSDPVENPDKVRLEEQYKIKFGKYFDHNQYDQRIKKDGLPIRLVLDLEDSKELRNLYNSLKAQIDKASRPIGVKCLNFSSDVISSKPISYEDKAYMVLVAH